MTLHRTAALTATGLALGAAAALTVTAASPASAVVVPDRHQVVCDSASFYPNYDSASGPAGTPRTLLRGDGIGHTVGAHPVYNGWAAVQDFGPNDWGFIRVECIG